MLSRGTYFTTMIATFFLAFLWALLPAKQASAAYDGGKLIDNAVFLDSASMSINDIQNFLASKGSGLASRSFVLNCYGADSKERQWYTAAGAPCDQNVPASHIIYYASQIYGVNPKVVLATLQKEQSLITSPNPTDWQINQAMGYGCPTSGGCGASTFFYQIDSGVWVLRYHYERARGNMQWWSPSTSWVCGTTKAYYNPNLYPNQNVNFVDEDGVYYRTHFLANAATSSFYCYTPHAYNNPQGLYGLPQYGNTGRYYSGSYNFVRFFEIWFGSVHTPSYAWQLTGQYAYTDETKTTARGLNNMLPGERAFIGYTVKNTGNVTWTNSGANPVNAGTLRPIGRNSQFFDDTWLGPNRPARLKESVVEPGQTGTFEFWIKAPYTQNLNFNEYFGIVHEGAAWMPDIGLYFGISVQPPSYSWQLTSQYAYTDDTKSTPRGLNGLEPGDRVYVGLTAKNQGNVTWKNTGPNPIHLGISRPYDRYSPFFENSWLGPNRPAKMKESSVAPGQTATFEFWMRTPNDRSGTIYEYFNLVSEGASWMNDLGLNFYTTVVTPNFSWSPEGQYAFTDNTKSTPIGLNNLSPGQLVYIGFNARNTSNFTWRNSGPYPIRAGTTRNRDRNSIFCNNDWISCSRPATMKQTSVTPGQVANFEFYYRIPNSPGTHKEYFSLLAESLGWFNDPGLNFLTTISQ